MSRKKRRRDVSHVLSDAVPKRTAEHVGRDGFTSAVIQRARTEAVEAVKSERDLIVRETEDKVHRIMCTLEKRFDSYEEQILVVEVNGIEKELSTVASPILEDLIVNIKLKQNTLLVGPAGCGKSIAAEQAAEALDMEFSALTLTAGASETWLFGRWTQDGFRNGSFAERYEHGGVLFLDELDAADSNTLLAINTALAGSYFYNPISGRMIQRHKDFVCVGAANTFGKGADFVYTGRSRLDGSTLDRFDVIPVAYNETIEAYVCPDDKLRGLLTEVRSRLTFLNSNEFLSTRAMDRIHTLYTAGRPLEVLMQRFTLPWTDELREQVKVEELVAKFNAPEGEAQPEGTEVPDEEPVNDMSAKCQCGHSYGGHSKGKDGPCVQPDCSCDHFRRAANG